jgi:hypothetical protein
MYTGRKDTINGFTKNFYIGSKMTDILFFVFMIGLPILYITPLILVFFDLKFIVPVAFILIQKFFQSKLVNNNVLESILLTPIQFILMSYVGFNSFYNTRRNTLSWKDRKINIDINK